MEEVPTHGGEASFQTVDIKAEVCKFILLLLLISFLNDSRKLRETVDPQAKKKVEEEILKKKELLQKVVQDR